MKENSLGLQSDYNAFTTAEMNGQMVKFKERVMSNLDENKSKVIEL